MGKVFFRPNCLTESSIDDRRVSLELADVQRLSGSLSMIEGCIYKLRRKPELLNKLTSFEQDEFFTELGVIEKLLRKIVNI